MQYGYVVTTMKRCCGLGFSALCLGGTELGRTASPIIKLRELHPVAASLMALNQIVKHSPMNLVNVNNQICLLSHNLIKYMNENVTWGLVELKKKGLMA